MSHLNEIHITKYLKNTKETTILARRYCTVVLFSHLEQSSLESSVITDQNLSQTHLFLHNFFQPSSKKKMFSRLLSRSTSKTAMFAGATLASATALISSTQVDAAVKQPNISSAKEQIANIINDLDVINPSCDDGAQGGGGGVAPMLLRLAWHSSGTWDKKAKNGGSEGGTMRFATEAGHGGNAGLQHARALLEPVKANNPELTYGKDFFLKKKFES